MLNDALETAGLTVLVALEGKQAITIAGKITPDIILLDAIMPHLDGFETCERLKANPDLCDVPIIFMTGLSDTESIVKGLNAGGVDYLTKPVDPDELMARMRVHLNNARRTNSAQCALDHTGHHLFTIDSAGHTLWATPQVRELFARAGAGDTWQHTQLPAQLLRWLRHHPQPNQALTLTGLEQPLEVRLVEHTRGAEVLLELLAGQGESGAERLRQALPVTGRESEVLYWIGNGKTNREIGQILSTSPRTVNKHLEQIFRKLEVDNRTSAAAIAIRVLGHHR
ncbi:response regulator [Exilibacterium tricleocarpae]|uniref:Response regulator n=2 Tax=Exilibacterium tricleocarpae TaxID=2591008 RepID=A0A545SZ21_9GAMM|nr:response regulator [Exilibacterium tricleocarpae]